MRVVNTTVGKVGQTIVGPRYVFNETIILAGQLGICISVDYCGDLPVATPATWIIGSIYDLKTYLSLDDVINDLGTTVINSLSIILSETAKTLPIAPIDRLAISLNISPQELKKSIALAEVKIVNT